MPSMSLRFHSLNARTLMRSLRSLLLYVCSSCRHRSSWVAVVYASERLTSWFCRTRALPRQRADRVGELRRITARGAETVALREFGSICEKTTWISEHETTWDADRGFTDHLLAQHFEL